MKEGGGTAAWLPDDPPKPLPPTAGLAEVLSSYEAQGHADPAEAWRAFTRTWNWPR